MSRASTDQPTVFRQTLQRLEQLAAQTAKQRSQILENHQQDSRQLEEEQAQARAELEAKRQQLSQQLEIAYKQQRRQIETSLGTEVAKLEEEYRGLRDFAQQDHDQKKEAGKKDMTDTGWTIASVAESELNEAREQLHHQKTQVKLLLEQEQEVAQHVIKLSQNYKQRTLLRKIQEEMLLEPVSLEDDRLAQLKQYGEQVEAAWQSLRRAWLPKVFANDLIFHGGWILLVLTAGLVGWLVQPLHLALMVGGGVYVLLLLGWLFLTRVIGKQQLRRLLQNYWQLTLQLQAIASRTVEEAQELYQRQRDLINQKKDTLKHEAEEKYRQLRADLKAHLETQLQGMDAKYPALIRQVQQRQEEKNQELELAHEHKVHALEEKSLLAARSLEQQQQAVREQLEAKYQRLWQQLAQRWQQGLQEFHQVVLDYQHLTDQWFPTWDDPTQANGVTTPNGQASTNLSASKSTQAQPAADNSLASSRWANWRAPTAMPPLLRFGSLTIDRRQIPGAALKDPPLQSELPLVYDVPAAFHFPAGGSVVIKGPNAKRTANDELLQVLALRYLTGMPAGKVRLMIIDPLGLGQSFAALMHLADYDEKLVTSRIWTEPSQIEQRLADLTEQMETIFQKYLRNQFTSIEEYNQFAGEIAEPFRVVVVANFPHNFSDTSFRRLVSIASTGVRCGVYLLVSVDTSAPIPHGLSLETLTEHTNVLFWKADQLLWQDQELQKYPLHLDRLPPATLLTPLLHRVGEQAKQAARVEIPFEIILPSEADYWTQRTDRDLNVPLGRAGATRLQSFLLGRGTSQHALVAGKTGSGKSTLFHVLITNAALRYSPEELAFYLIDFKKGVEFKTYATFDLPHAQVVAVESEREFGLSVLRRLDAELTRRGDLYRELGVQDLAGYRQKPNQPTLPRLLLLIDEFQELFTEDDKVAQDASLLLDRLVRQGRAFGIHVILGSQTLGGAYSLARATLGQMAIRVALQCSEADARLILSDENAAARLLSRPGEGIYNDQNGLVEGNSPFQIAWLPDQKRDHYLEQVQQLAKQRGWHRQQPQIVFEGNAPANLVKNHLLRQLLQAPKWENRLPVAHAWLGDAISIKDPTAASFRRESGNHLLLIGQDEESARGLFAAILLSLAAQHRPSAAPLVDESALASTAAAAEFWILDGTHADSQFADFFERLGQRLPHRVERFQPRQVHEVMEQLGERYAQRQADPDRPVPSIYLFLFDLARFRDLRKREDDYSFGMGDSSGKLKPDAQLVQIIREGALFGIHTITWCDSLNNLNRTFERAVLREIALRILFQMSTNDSSMLIDSPAASRLGPNRALFVHEEEALEEKFRPYGLPPEDWLDQYQQALAQREPRLEKPKRDWSTASVRSQGQIEENDSESSGS